MICPACGHLLKKIHINGVEVDACHGGCGGLWFDNFELKRFDEPHEPVNEAMLLVPIEPTIHFDPDMKRDCPRCAVPMMRHYFNQQRRTHMDSCPQCGGNWLDAGELTQVRAEFREKANRTAAKAQVNKHLRWFAADS
jgi:Zn-finger nucleic acid-binding protein